MATANSKPLKAKTAKEIMTLPEAARYLRVTESVLRQLAEQEGIPARKVGKEWRFLKPALQDWLRRSDDPSSKERLLQLAGVWKDDPTVDDMVREIYRQRKQNLVGDQE